MRVTAVDWPGVIPITRKVTARLGVAERFRFVAGDVLEASFGSGYSIATAGHILHSEGEARSRRLLKEAFDALAPGGTLAIAEILVDANRTSPLPALIFALSTRTRATRFRWARSAHGSTTPGSGTSGPSRLPGLAPLIILATK